MPHKIKRTGEIIDIKGQKYSVYAFDDESVRLLHVRKNGSVYTQVDNAITRNRKQVEAEATYVAHVANELIN